MYFVKDDSGRAVRVRGGPVLRAIRRSGSAWELGVAYDRSPVWHALLLPIVLLMMGSFVLTAGILVPLIGVWTLPVLVGQLAGEIALYKRFVPQCTRREVLRHARLLRGERPDLCPACGGGLNRWPTRLEHESECGRCGALWRG